MSNLGTLANQTTKAVALSNLILVTPQTNPLASSRDPRSVIGYQVQNVDRTDGITLSSDPAILFHYEGENSVSLKSDITDHYVEDNSAIQDQIALRPESITTNGFIGELNDVAGIGLQTLKFLADKLFTISGYEPEQSISAQIAYNNAKFAYDVAATIAKSAVSTWSTIAGSSGQAVVNGNGISNTNKPMVQSRQEIVFQQFYGYWRKRRLFTIQTPWAVFQDCAIESFRTIQDADTRMISDFEITFKLIRYAKTKTVGTQIEGVYDFKNMQQRAYNQASPEINIGPNTPSNSDSLTSRLS